MDDGELVALMAAIVISSDRNPDISRALQTAEEIYAAVVQAGYKVDGKRMKPMFGNAFSAARGSSEMVK